MMHSRPITSPGLRRSPGGPAAFLMGMASMLTGVRLLFTARKIRRLAAFPIVISLGLYIAIAAAAMVWTDDALALFWQRPQGAWMLSLWYAVVVCSILLLMVGLLLIHTTIIELIGAPFFERIACTIAQRHGHTCHAVPVIGPIVAAGVRSLLLLMVVIICYLLGLIPVIGAPFIAIGFVIAAFQLGVSALEPVVLVATTDHAVMRFAREHPMFLLGVGTAMTLVLLLPLTGPFTLAIATIGASDRISRHYLP